MPKLRTIGVDADDTLWHNERYFRLTHDRFAGLLAPYSDAPDMVERLKSAEKRNLGIYGFGVKGFVLSMVETAVEVTEGAVPGHVVAELLQAGQEMLRYPIELLPHARETLERIAPDYDLVLITKGDLWDQERKLAQSGLGELFDAVEIVSDKTPEIYTRLFVRHGAGPENGAMVGNSLRSDVAPMIAAGGWGIHVPQELGWDYEADASPQAAHRFREIASLAGLPDLLDEIAQA